MSPIRREFTFLTAAFSHGAYQSQNANRPELRGPSVKGQLRWWFDALFSDIRAEHKLFGHVQSRQNRELGLQGNVASRLVVRVQALENAEPYGPVEFMPHKGERGGRKHALRPGARYAVELVPRRDGLSPEEQDKVERCLDAWLLFGAVGQRANRGAGSPWPAENAPATLAEYETHAADLLVGTKLRVASLGTVADEKQLRSIAGDILAADAFLSVGTPFGSARPRKPSQLRLRAAHLGGELHLVAVWDGRCQSGDSLRKAIGTLAKSKELGRRLETVADRLCS